MNIFGKCLFSVLICACLAPAWAAAGPFDSGSGMAGLPADVYPSQRAAVEGLASQLPAALRVAAEDAREIHLNGNLPAEQIRILRDVIGDRLPSKATVVVPTIGESRDEAPGGVRITADLLDVTQTEVSWQTEPVRSGIIRLTLRAGQGDSSTLSARFEEKLWADDFSAFTNLHSGQWVLGHSDRPSLTEMEAAHAARDDAANSIWPMFEARLGPAHGFGRDMARLRERLVQDLDAEGLIVDHFAQRFTRPYGEVCTDRVLVDASPSKLEPMVRRYESILQGRHVAARHRLGASAGLLIVIALLYTVLNAVTRGYFTFRLRTVALIAALAVVFAIAARG